MKTKVIQTSVIRAETPEEAIKIAKKGQKYFDFVSCEPMKCFKVMAVIEVKEADEATQKEILGT